MTCEVETLNGTVHIRGDMTIYAAAGLKGDLLAALADQPEPHVVDLSEVAELDTTGVQLLLLAARECKALSLLNPSDIVREALALLRLHDVHMTPTDRVNA
jgi:anti-anti-sigma factor